MADRNTVCIRAYSPGDRDAIMALAPRLTEGAAAAERTHFSGQADAQAGELVTAAGMERRGIALALMQAAEAWGAARGLDHRTLESGAANEADRAFYAALGYLDEDVRLTKKIRTGTG